MQPNEFSPNAISLTKDNSIQLTGQSFETWIRFTGFFDGKLKGTFLSDNVKATLHYYQIILEISEIFLEIIIDRNLKIIENRSILLENRKTGTGLEAHQNQLRIAKQLGYKKIFLRAVGGLKHQDKIFNGHVTWAKFGYTMSDTSHDIFKKSKFGLEVDCLQKIFLGEEELKQDWESNGYDWDGVFDLQPNSINHRLLAVYEHRRVYKRQPFVSS